MLESKKSNNFFGTRSTASEANVGHSRSAICQSFPRNGARRPIPISLSLGIKLVKFGVAVRRIEATR